MPCYQIPDGFLCIGNEPVAVKHKGTTYRFEWTEACGWMAVNRDGNQRLSPVPSAVWNLLAEQQPRKGT